MIIITKERLLTGWIDREEDHDHLEKAFCEACKKYNLDYCITDEMVYCPSRKGGVFKELTMRDFYMTVERFFDNGYQFTYDDKYSAYGGFVYNVTRRGKGVRLNEANTRVTGDDKRFVIFAECLAHREGVTQC